MKYCYNGNLILLQNPIIYPEVVSSLVTFLHLIITIKTMVHLGMRQAGVLLTILNIATPSQLLKTVAMKVKMLMKFVLPPFHSFRLS